MSFAAGAFSSGARGGGHSSGNDSNRRQFGVGGNKGGVQSCQGKDGTGGTGAGGVGGVGAPGGVAGGLTGTGPPGGGPTDPSSAGMTTTSLAMAFQALASKSSAALMGPTSQK